MELIIIKSGALVVESLSAFAIVKLDEDLFDEPISARRHGWLVRAAAGFQSSDFSGLPDNDPKLTFQPEYAKPFGLRDQFVVLTGSMLGADCSAGRRCGQHRIYH